MGIRYSEAFIEQALFKVYSRGERTVKLVAVELNINHHTLKNWMKRKKSSAIGVSVKKERRPQDWNAEQQLAALHETYACQVNHCRPGVVKTAYLPITSPAGKRLFAPM